MTVQEAKDKIEEYDNVAGLMVTLPHRVCEVAIEALEKQIPKKPIRHEEEITEEYFSLEYYSCPNCQNNELTDDYDFWCFHCGQKLDWSEEE